MTIKIEMTIKYFSVEFGACEYTTFEFATNMDEAKQTAAHMLALAESDAMDDDAMMDTFYYEWDYIMPQSLADDLQLDYVMEPA